jgi:hypothetical protein
MLTAVMIGLSILRINRTIDRMHWLDQTLRWVHIIGIPVAVLTMALYVFGSSQSDGQTASSFMTAMRQALQ